MRVSEHFDRLEDRIRELEKAVEALKAGQTTVTLESEPIGKAAPTKKTAGTDGQTAKKAAK